MRGKWIRSRASFPKRGLFSNNQPNKTNEKTNAPDLQPRQQIVALAVRSARRTELKLNSVFSRQFDQKRQFRLSFFEFFSASRKETIKTARHAHHDHREAGVPQHSWRMGNSFGKIDYVTPSPTEQLSADIYLEHYCPGLVFFLGTNQAAV